MDGTGAASHLIGALSSSRPAREDRHLDDHTTNLVGAGISVCVLRVCFNIILLVGIER